jgi:hypothetical protein
LLDPQQFESAESLQEDCKDFLESACGCAPLVPPKPLPPPADRARCSCCWPEITQFNHLVNSITTVFEAHAAQIQTEKLKTIGLRNIIDMQRENQRRTEQRLSKAADATTAELERLSRTYESLLKVEGEQRLLIDKLSNSEL